MRSIPLILAALLAAAAPLHAEPFEVKHAQGVTTVAEAPARTVVFDLAALDNLHALGAEAVGVPDARFAGALEHYADARYAKVGTLFEPDLEAVRALAPDLIIVGDRSAPSYDALAEIAPTLDLTPATDSFFSDALAAIESMGRLYDREAQATTLVAELRELRDQVMARAQGQDGVVLFTLNGNASPHAPGARFGTPLDVLGLASTLPALDTPWVRTADTRSARPKPGSPEAEAARAAQAQALGDAMAADPDWLIVLDRGAATGGGEATDLSQIEAVTATSAWQAGRVFRLDPAGWYLSAGSHTVLRQTLEQFLQALEGAR
ncbi:ABC transporter substrate-binding protein [Luteimonas sp. MJ293]|uniref:siderophore ABC transporter substrate-binding protein n=1 Tax=Luteimonas sp. MJ146 TaxID=3129240 RepID=UPI0031BA704A